MVENHLRVPGTRLPGGRIATPRPAAAGPAAVVISWLSNAYFNRTPPLPDSESVIIRTQ